TGRLFAASVIPAFLMAIGLCIAVWLLTREDDSIQQMPFDRGRFGSTLKGVLGAAVAPVIILGGILSGAFTPTEAAAVGALYILILGFVYRTVRVKDLPRILSETVSTTASIMLIVAAAALLGYIMSLERVPQMLADAVLGFTDNGMAYAVVVAPLLLLLGTSLAA